MRLIIYTLLLCVSSGFFSCKQAGDNVSDTSQVWIWRSIAFDVEIDVKCLDVPRGRQQAIAAKLSKRTDEIEQLFSLYIAESVISQLNKHGFLNQTPDEFIDVIEQCVALGDKTQGLFDITVQPLWEYYQKLPNDPSHKQQLTQVLNKVNYRNIVFNKEAKTIGFKVEGMKLTLNGMIQGYLTDELIKILKQEGVEHALVNAGEYRAVGRDGEKEWSIDIQTPKHHLPIATITLDHDKALAVSAGYGHTFDTAGKSHHLFHPKNAINQPVNRTIVVLAESSAKADALATAFAVCPDQGWSGLLKTIDSYAPIGVEVFEGKELIWSSH